MTRHGPSWASIATGLLIALAATVVTVPGAAVADPAPATSEPVNGPGADDPFCTPPAGYENTTPGTILASRPVQVKELELLPVRAQAWQLLYRTTNSNGEP